MIKVLIVDDEAIVRQGIASLLMLEPDLEIVGQAQNGEKACELVTALDPEVVLMDIRMPVCDGIKALQQILAQRPDHEGGDVNYIRRRFPNYGSAQNWCVRLPSKRY